MERFGVLLSPFERASGQRNYSSDFLAKPAEVRHRRSQVAIARILLDEA
jgi:hypothetical protein